MRRLKNNCNSLNFHVCYIMNQNKQSGRVKRNQTLLLTYNALALKWDCILLNLASQHFCFHPIESSGEGLCAYPKFQILKYLQAWIMALYVISFLFCGLPPAKSHIQFTLDNNFPLTFWEEVPKEHHESGAHGAREVTKVHVQCQQGKCTVPNLEAHVEGSQSSWTSGPNGHHQVIQADLTT